ncbi:Mg2+ transporter protein cora-like protein [Syncephalis plumigaleata]|nr:Mg2+ transporter protein cora-like protein [Syncephalis plumigaleata]
MSSSPATHKGDIKLRCTEFDHTGNVKTTAGEFSKHQLCVGPRDLRKIDSNFVNQLPAILVRDEVILVNLGHIRALIRADLVILFDTYGSTDSFHQSTFIYDLQEKLRNPGGTYGSLPFEFRAMESILISVVSSLQSEMDVLSGLVTNLLAHLEEHIDRDKLKELLQYSKRLARFEQKTLNIRDAVLEVLEEDEDLTEMCLTSKKNNRENINDYHEDIELLMETYLKQIEEIANVASSLTANMRTTEDIVNIMLDSQRNSLLLFELRLAMVTMGLTGGAFIASIFGMNLLSTLENNPYAFFVVSGTAVAAASFAFTLAMRRMRLLVKQS